MSFADSGRKRATTPIMKVSRRRFIEASALSIATGLVSPAIAREYQEKNQRSALKPLTVHDGKALALLSRMTLEEKIGQMVQAEQNALKDVADVEKYFLGSILSGGR